MVSAYNNLASLLRKTGYFSEAEKEVRTALDYEPSNTNLLGTLGDVLADEGWFEDAEKYYKSALEYSEKAEDAAKSEIHNNLGWVYTQKKLYNNAKEEFFAAKTLDPKNVKAIRNLRALTRIKQPSEINREQIYISALLLLPLSFSIYMFWISKLQETAFSALFLFFIAAILFVLLHRSIGRFSVGPKGVEFEMSTEHRQSSAKAQMADAISKIER